MNYPLDVKPKYCRVCGGELKYRAFEEPDEDWHDTVVRKLRQNPKHVQWDGAHPKTDVLVSILEVPIKGQTLLFIPHQELLDMGYSSLEDFKVVRCNERYFELQGYNTAVDAWWVEEIPLEDLDSR